MGITVARRVCASCQRTTGLALWRWTGRAFLTTHGLCRRCLDRALAPTSVRRQSADAAPVVLVSDLLS